MDPEAVRRYNRDAWNRQVREGNRWTVPVDSRTIARARRGDWQVVLTPTIPVPRAWFPEELRACRLLGLAAGGGQQGPVLAAAGADVTVYDNSPAQLAQDRSVAAREGLALRTVEGDMRDLSAFADSSFDLVFHPCSNAFVPEVRPVWNEAFRVLRSGGRLLAGFSNPVRYLFEHSWSGDGPLRVRHTIPYSDLTARSAEELAAIRERGEPLEFGHTLGDQIAGQLDAGFVLRGFFEDRYDPADSDALSSYLATFIATFAEKP